MTRSLVLLASAALLASCGSGPEVVARFEGEGSSSTPSFDIEGPWTATWVAESDDRDHSSFELSARRAAGELTLELGRGFPCPCRGESSPVRQSGTFVLRVRGGNLTAWTVTVLRP